MIHIKYDIKSTNITAEGIIKQYYFNFNSADGDIINICTQNLLQWN